MNPPNELATHEDRESAQSRLRYMLSQKPVYDVVGARIRVNIHMRTARIDENGVRIGHDVEELKATFRTAGKEQLYPNYKGQLKSATAKGFPTKEDLHDYIKKVLDSMTSEKIELFSWPAFYNCNLLGIFQELNKAIAKKEKEINIAAPQLTSPFPSLEEVNWVARKLTPDMVKTMRTIYTTFPWDSSEKIMEVSMDFVLFILALEIMRGLTTNSFKKPEELAAFLN